MRYEVRCCCTPKNLLGWIESDRKLVSGDVLCYVVLSEMPRIVTEEKPPTEAMTKRIEFQAEMYRPKDFDEPYLALKSPDASMLDLKRIYCFVEAP